VKRVLAGAAFAAPFIATFSVDGLSAGSAEAASFANISNSCSNMDAGYVGPTLFQAHLFDPTGQTTANGQAQFQIVGAGGGEDDDNAGHKFVELATTLTMTSNTTAINGHIEINGQNVASLTQGRGFIGPANIHGLCDFNSLLQAMAAGLATCVVTATFMAASHTLSGPIHAAGSETVKVNP
jgi:hypothetical protein